MIIGMISPLWIYHTLCNIGSSGTRRLWYISVIGGVTDNLLVLTPLVRSF